VEEYVVESLHRAVLYIDLLGFAALVESRGEQFVFDGGVRFGSIAPACDPVTNRLSLFHKVLECKIAAEQPNYAMVFSDCSFTAFYTTAACARFAAALMREFLIARVPVRMGLGFGTFQSGGTSTAVNGRSTVVRSNFAGTSVVRAVAAESCGAKGMRIFADASFSDAHLRTDAESQQHRLIRMPNQCKAVFFELDYLSHAAGELINSCAAAVREMSREALPEYQNHYSETLAAFSRMR
jgi:hypothetical protein